MRGITTILLCCMLWACATQRAASPPLAWEQRMRQLQQAAVWHLDGRAAVAFGTQGWQATLSWQQANGSSDLRLSGPFGIGAVDLKRSVDGLSLNGAPPGEGVLNELADKLGFDLPIDDLRYWLLGVPNPGMAQVTFNTQDRASRIVQDGWSVDYDRYMPVVRDRVGGDVLPAHVVLSRDNVRVKILIDHWTWMR